MDIVDRDRRPRPGGRGCEEEEEEESLFRRRRRRRRKVY